MATRRNLWPSRWKAKRVGTQSVLAGCRFAILADVRAYASIHAVVVLAVMFAVSAATFVAGQELRNNVRRVDADGHELPYPAVARIGRLPFQQGHSIEVAAFIKQGRELVVLKKDASIAVIDMASGLERLAIDTGGTNVAEGRMAVSPDGRFAAINRNHGDLRLWRLSDGQLCDGQLSDGQRAPSFQPSRMLDGRIAFTPDGEHLVIEDSGNRRARLWKVATGAEVRQFPELSATMSELAISPDGRLLAMADEKTSVHVCDMSTGELLVTLPKNGLCFALAFDSHGKRLAMPDSEGKIPIWDVVAGKLLQTLDGHSLGVVGVAILPDDERLASYSMDGSVRLWELATGKISHSFPVHAPRTGGNAFAVSPDGSVMAASSALRWIDLKTNQLKPAPMQGGGPVAWSRRGDALLTGEDTIVLWNAKTGQAEKSFTPPRLETIRACGFGEDEQAVIGITTRGGLCRFQRSTGALLAQSIIRPPVSAVFSPDGSRLAVGTLADLAGIVHTTTLDAITILKHPPLAHGNSKSDVKPRQVSTIAWDAKGSQLITATYFGAQYSVGMIQVWDVATETWSLELPFASHLHGPPLEALAVTPDGRLIVAVTNDNHLRMWDRNSGVEAHVARNFARCRSLTISHDGRWLAANDGKFVKIVPTLAPHAEVCRLVGHRAPIRSLQFSPDDRWLASGSDDGTTLVWRLEDLAMPNQPIEASHLVRRFWADLASRQASVVFTAQSNLLLAGDSILPTIEALLSPPPRRVDPAKVAQLIEQLDSNHYAEREAAFDALWRLAPWVRSSLQEAATKGRSWEIKLRARRLLARLERAPANLELSPTLSFIQVLEHLDTAASRDMLESIAGWTTTDVEPAAARAALERLRRVAPTTPEPPSP